MKLRWAAPLVTGLGVGLVRLLAATWRYRVHGWEHVQETRRGGRPIVYVLWHSRLLPLIHHRRGEGVALLISRNRDGGYLADLCERWGYNIVRGSSHRGGAVGLRGLIRYLEEGHEVGTTPDGPRGPAGQVKPGAVAAAQHSHALVIPMGARTAAAWWIHSWDRFCIPYPFATIDVVYGAPITVAEGKDGLRRGIEATERALNEVTYGEGGRGKREG